MALKFSKNFTKTECKLFLCVCGICVVLYRHLEIVLQFIAGVKTGAAGGKKTILYFLFYLKTLVLSLIYVKGIGRGGGGVSYFRQLSRKHQNKDVFLFIFDAFLFVNGSYNII